MYLYSYAASQSPSLVISLSPATKLIFLPVDEYAQGNIKKIVSVYDQETPQSPQKTPWHREEEPLNRHETPGRQIKQSNQLSLPHQDDCNTRMDIK